MLLITSPRAAPGTASVLEDARWALRAVCRFPCTVLADIVGFAMGRTARVVLFGTFRVEIDGRAVPPSAWRHRRGADVVKLLALQPSHRLHRERAMTALWPDLAQDLAAANQRKALLYARRALEDEGAVRSSDG